MDPERGKVSQGRGGGPVPANHIFGSTGDEGNGPIISRDLILFWCLFLSKAGLGVLEYCSR